ncbi:MAG: thioredoxin [Pseudomonadota bacterium]
MTHTSPYIFDIDGDVFEEKVINASRQQPVLVDFWADWCSPCLMIAPVLAKVIPEYEGKVLLAKIDADENMKLAGHYKLRGFPTIVMFVDGEEVARFGGAKSAPEVRKFIDNHMPI